MDFLRDGPSRFCFCPRPSGRCQTSSPVDARSRIHPLAQCPMPETRCPPRVRFFVRHRATALSCSPFSGFREESHLPSLFANSPSNQGRVFRKGTLRPSSRWYCCVRKRTRQAFSLQYPGFLVSLPAAGSFQRPLPRLFKGKVYFCPCFFPSLFPSLVGLGWRKRWRHRAPWFPFLFLPEPPFPFLRSALLKI